MRFARLFALIPILWTTSCGGQETVGPMVTRTQRTIPEVWTTFYPTTYFTQRLAGDLVKVVCPVPEGEDPAFWKPDDDVLRGYQAADLIVINGADFEKWLNVASLPASHLVNASKSFEKAFLKLEGSTTHSHSGGAAHTHEGIDGHTWFDPVNAKAQALSIRRGLVLMLPEKSAILATNYEALAKDLDALDAAFKALGSLPESQHLYFSHPAWNYPAERYGWKRVNLTLAPEEKLKQEDIAKLKKSLAEKPGRHILWEDEPLPATSELLERELGLKSLIVPPCESESAEDRAAGRDYLARMRANVEVLRAAFSR